MPSILSQGIYLVEEVAKDGSDTKLLVGFHVCREIDVYEDFNEPNFRCN